MGGVTGEVKRVGVRSSTIRMGQGAEVVIPKSKLAHEQLTNWTLSDRTRLGVQAQNGLRMAILRSRDRT